MVACLLRVIKASSFSSSLFHSRGPPFAPLRTLSAPSPPLQVLRAMSSTPEPVQALLVTASKEEAESLAEKLVERRLCACVNVVPGLTSVCVHLGGAMRRGVDGVLARDASRYRWEGTSSV